MHGKGEFKMKKIASVLAACALLLALSAGCGRAAAPAASPSSSAGGSSSAVSGKKLKVYASFYAMYDFAKKAGGGRVEVTNLVPAGTEPHDWEPSATDIRTLEQADVLVYNGAGMESWVDKVVGSLENKTLVAAEASKGINLMAGHAEEGEEAAQYDPHVWLDPKNAKTELANIRDAFLRADPDGKDEYEANYQTYAAEFDELDKKYRDAISALPKKDIVVSHQAFGYLCRAYGLNQVPIEGLSADAEPDPKRMGEIIDFVKKNDVKYIFFEELVSPKVAETVASETGAKTVEFNPLEGLSDEQQAAGGDYISVMEQNLQVLKEALQ